jgi:hypothetical protein
VGPSRRKTMKKNILCLALILSASSVALTGCNGKKVNESASESAGKTQLNIATFDGGFGTEWLSEMATRFESKYASTSFEEGKTGVYVKVDGNKTGYNGSSLLANGLGSDMDVYFTEGISYFQQMKQFADITDCVQAKLTDFGESKSIEDKLDANFKSYLTASDGHYYALPFYDGLYGFIYDVDLFDKNDFYFGSDGHLIASASDAKSTGPDGKAGTYDDGLPSTYAQFDELTQAMRDINIVPFCHTAGSASAHYYVNRVMLNYWADHEGKDEMNLNYTLTGTSKDLASIDDKGALTTTSEAITVDNAYDLQKQAGKYYALSFLQNQFFGQSKRNIDSVSSSHTTTQTNFVKSTVVSNATTYGMLVDGDWWENEATAAFKYCEQYGKGKANRHYAFMPIPKATAAKVGESQTLVSQNSSYGFINKETKKLSLAKLFLQFAHTDSEMSKFTAKTSTTRALNYAIASADEATMTSFGKSIVQLKANSTIIYPYSSAKKELNNASFFDTEAWAWSTFAVGKNHTDPYSFYYDDSGDALSYFNGLYTYTKGKWSTLQ